MIGVLRILLGLVFIGASFRFQGLIPDVAVNFFNMTPVYGHIAVLRHWLLFIPGVYFLASVVGPLVGGERADRLIRLLLRPSSRFFMVLVFSLALTAGLAINWGLLDGIPHVQDELAQFFQARIFASGRLWLTPPPAEEHDFYQVQFVMLEETKWYGKYLAGFQLVLALFVLAKAPWLISPLSSAFAVVLIYKFCRRVFSEFIARLAALLLLVSPFYLGLTGTMMNHTFSLMLVIGFMQAWLVGVQEGKLRYHGLMGFLVGLLMNTRPMTAACLSLPFLLWYPYAWLQKRLSFSGLLAPSVAIGLWAGFYLTYNWLYTGDPFLTASTRSDSSDVVGFGPNVGHKTLGGGTHPGYTVQQAWINLGYTLLLLNEMLFGWPSVSLAPLALALLYKKRTKLELMAAAALSLNLLGYFFYYSLGLCMGPRYQYEAIPVLIILSARGIAIALGMGERGQGRAGRLAPMVLVALALLFARSWIRYVPKILSSYSEGFWNIDTALRDQVQEQGLHNAVVFVESSSWLLVNGTGPDYYGISVLLNDLDGKGDVIYVRDLGYERNAWFMARHPGREAYRFRYGRMVRAERVAEGPRLIPGLRD